MDVKDRVIQPRRPGSGEVAMQRFATRAHTFFYRLSGGRLGGRMFGGPVLLLTTIGRKSGRPRVAPLLYLADGEHIVLVASNGGTSTHPLWYLNLQANPRAHVLIRSQLRDVVARQAMPEERTLLWPKLVAMYPGYADYQQRTAREIPVMILEVI